MVICITILMVLFIYFLPSPKLPGYYHNFPQTSSACSHIYSAHLLTGFYDICVDNGFIFPNRGARALRKSIFACIALVAFLVNRTACGSPKL